MLFLLSVASQVYKTSGNEEYVINGNDVIMKCNIPSFVADFVQITGWIDSEGKEYLLDNDYGNSIVKLDYLQEITSFRYQRFGFLNLCIFLGNCHVYKIKTIHELCIYLFLVASQIYETSGNIEYVINGNDVIMKCTIPSFVADFLSITSWVDSEGTEYLLNSDYGN